MHVCDVHAMCACLTLCLYPCVHPQAIKSPEEPIKQVIFLLTTVDGQALGNKHVMSCRKGIKFTYS